ncbi:MAG: hypothetical protein ACJ72M_00555 [Propionibacteriaceae bacterium]|jgi:hypothetical protein
MMKTVLIGTSLDRWRAMIRCTGVVGIVTIVLLFTSLIASSPGEPPFIATAEQAQAYFLNLSQGWIQATMAVTSLSAIGLIWFVAGLCLLFGRAEGSPPWRSAVALVSGVLLPTYLLLNSTWNVASFGARDLDLAVASYAFDTASLGLANIWLAMGSFAVCCGWVILSTRLVGRWLGWWGIASGVGLAISRFFWTLEFWYLPYVAFWIWMIIICIQFVRKPGALLRAADGRTGEPGELP